MDFYLVFLNKGIVVSISKFDDENVRDKAYDFWRDRNYLDRQIYDEVQVFNEVD